MRRLLIVTMLTMAVPTDAQAPPSLAQLLQHAEQQRQAAQAEMLATDAGKRFVAWQAQENGLRARIDAEQKSAEGSK